jgi:hypothetical protein
MNSESSETAEEAIARLTARVFMLESLIDRIASLRRSLEEENDRLKAVIIKMQAGTKLLRKALDKAADMAIDKYISGIGIN